MVKKIIILIPILFFSYIIIMFAIKDNKKEWYEEVGEDNIYYATESFLKTKVNYPDTFEFTEYPKFVYATEEERIVEVSGDFKCANGFGVYEEHKFYVKIEIKDKWIIKDYIIY